MCSKPIADSIAISAQGLTKSYRIWSDPADRIFSAFWAYLSKVLPGSAGSALRKKSSTGYHDFFALSDITFDVKRGEAVGIIGRNGAGKSTLLQIIAGTLQPSSGSISINGRVAALLELGAGFNPEFTGRENIFLTGAIIGMSKEEMQKRYADITSFADIGEFIEQPIKTYSSGMQVRLALIIALIIVLINALIKALNTFSVLVYW
jgi:lipopolysaccharide transport system ATP-binding protein